MRIPTQNDSGIISYLLDGSTPLYLHSSGTTTTSGKDTFSQWFAPVSQLGSNRVLALQLPLT